MKDKEFHEWSKIRKKGKINFILKYGMLLYGVSTGILLYILELILDQKFSLTLFTQYTFYRDMIAQVIAYSIIAGPLYGILMWIFNEKRWKKEKDKLK